MRVPGNGWRVRCGYSTLLELIDHHAKNKLVHLSAAVDTRGIPLAIERDS